MGDCQPLGYSLAGGPMCRDNATGNMVYCTVPACSVPAAPSGYGGTPGYQPPPTQITNVPVPGFQGDFTVPTLESTLQAQLSEAESTFESNVIAQGGDTAANQALQFGLIASQHCALYPTSPGCDQAGSLADRYANMYLAWAGRQPAAIYTSRDPGVLTSPGSPASPLVGTPPPNYQPAPPPAPSGFQTSATAQIVNLSRPGSGFQVGDNWQLTVKGPARQAVVVSATQNGKSVGQNTPMGTTDDSGTLVLTGTFDNSVVGSWVETWQVRGANSAAPLSFSVAAPPPSSSTGSGSGPQSGGSSSGSPPPASQTGPNNGGGPVTQPALDFSFLSQTAFTIGGVNVSYLGAGAAALAAFVFLPSLLGGRR